MLGDQETAVSSTSLRCVTLYRVYLNQGSVLKKFLILKPQKI
jgi:hypothetical protein